jgi:hypothetical protein
MKNEKWMGIFKLMEEAGELIQVLSKLGASPAENRPDGSVTLATRVTDEIADLYAALDYFVETNGLDGEPITNRRREKTAKFHKRQLTGISPQGTLPMNGESGAAKDGAKAGGRS